MEKGGVVAVCGDCVVAIRWVGPFVSDLTWSAIFLVSGNGSPVADVLVAGFSEIVD